MRNSVKTFGRINTLDAFYSLKPMVFSQEQGQLAMLDNTLSLQGSVLNLPRNGLPTSGAGVHERAELLLVLRSARHWP